MGMARLVRLGILLLAQAGPDQERLTRELAAVLDSRYAVLDAATRNEAARRLADTILKSKDPSRNAAAVLEVVKFKLVEGLGFVEDVDAYARALGRALESALPEARTALSLPPRFRIREAERNLELVDAYLTEVVPSRPPSEAERTAILGQLGQIAGEIRDQARKKIYGAYAGSLVDRMVLANQKYLSGSIGDPLVGGLTRPLTAEELHRVLAGIREDLGAVDPVEASSEAERRYLESGVVDIDAETPGMRLASRAAKWLFAVPQLNYPRTVAAEESLYDVSRDAKAWVDGAAEPLKAELKGKNLALQPILERPKTPEPRPSALVAGKATSPAADPTQRPSPPAASEGGRGFRLWPFALVLGILAAIAVAWRGRTRDQSVKM